MTLSKASIEILHGIKPIHGFKNEEDRFVPRDDN